MASFSREDQVPSLSELVTKYEDGLTRCAWPKRDEMYIEYHDTEWGVPVVGENELFERVCLEGFQAGLSWITILKRREGFRKAFKGFQINKVAQLTEQDVERLMLDEGIIRNRAKIVSTISNAKLCLNLDMPLSEIIWSHAPKAKTVSTKNFEILAQSKESENLSRELKSLGFSFVGPTTMYALMQSIGMVNDHAPGCFRRNQLRD
jgi:DNA-3-methyladenine glycosylase I